MQILLKWQHRYCEFETLIWNGFTSVYCQAVKIGVNLIVLDDGWFGTRNDDSSSLGDWIVNLTKFPKGLCALVEEVNALGCKFGIWIEPEMVSENSVRQPVL
jgi:alpha-galactosidase